MKKAFPHRSLQARSDEYEMKYAGHDGSYIEKKEKNFCEVPPRKSNDPKFSFDPELKELIAQYKFIRRELQSRGIDPDNC